MGTSSSTSHRSSGAWQRAESRILGINRGARAAPSPQRASQPRSRRSAPAALEHPPPDAHEWDGGDVVAAAANPLARSAVALPVGASAETVPSRGARAFPAWRRPPETAGAGAHTSSCTERATSIPAPTTPAAVAAAATADGCTADAPPASGEPRPFHRQSQTSTEERGNTCGARRASMSFASANSPTALPLTVAMMTFAPVVQDVVVATTAGGAVAPTKAVPFEEPGLLSATSFAGATMSVTMNGDVPAGTSTSSAEVGAPAVVAGGGRSGQSAGEEPLAVPGAAATAAAPVRVAYRDTAAASSPTPAPLRRFSVVSFREATEDAGDFAHTVLSDVSMPRIVRIAPSGSGQQEGALGAAGIVQLTPRGRRNSNAGASARRGKDDGGASAPTVYCQGAPTPQNSMRESAMRPLGDALTEEGAGKGDDCVSAEDSAWQLTTRVSPPSSVPGSDVSSVHSNSRGSAAYALLASQQMSQAAEELESYTATMRVVLRSWECVSERYEELAEELSCLIGKAHPEYAQLFVTSSLSAQARVMLNMIGEALVVVARPSEMFSRLLEMGALHRRYNVGEEHFLALQSAFTAILPKYLPADMRGSCEAAWEPFWRTVTQLLVHGRTSARGDWHAAQQQALFFAESRQLISAVAEGQRTASERGTFMTEMLERAVAADPSMERFALLRDRRTSVRAFNGIVRLLNGSEDAVATQLLMEELSVRHTVYGLDVAAMRGFRQPFIDTCRQALRRVSKRELWVATAPRSLGTFWDHVAESWAKALVHAAKSRKSQAERAPDGSEPFCLMFTDIEASTRLWERNASVMGEAVEAHHHIIRSAIADFGAYEVKTVGDAFVIAAKDVLIAVRIALAIQLEFMRAPIAKGFEMVPNPQGGGSADCWRRDSLRVRIGIHLCRDASAVYDSVQRRYDYYGPSVNCTARVESAASGGQILISEEALEALQAMPEMADNPVVVLTGNEVPDEFESSASSFGDSHDLLCGARPLADLMTVRDWGTHTFKGIDRLVQVYSVLPRKLGGRSFDRVASSVGSSSLSSALTSVIVKAKAWTADQANVSVSVSEFEQSMHH